MPLIDAALPNRVFSNRKGYGALKAIEMVKEDIREMSNNFTEDCFIMKTDFSGYFPNAIWDKAYERLEKLIIDKYHGEDKEDLLWLLKVSIYANPSAYCECRGDLSLWRFIKDGKSVLKQQYGKGGAIGFLIWQMAMTYYTIELDLFLAGIKDIRYVRFVDDIVIIGKDKRKMLLLMPEIRRICINVGCTLNEQKFYFQHYTKGLEFLGSHIKFQRTYLNNSSIYRFKSKLIQYNKAKVKQYLVVPFRDMVNSYLGMMKIRSEWKCIHNTIENEINSEWWEYFTWNAVKKCIKPKVNYFNAYLWFKVR